MPSFKFVCEHRSPWDETVTHKNTMEFDEDKLDFVVAEFQDFLRGCGFYFDGRLEIVDDEQESDDADTDVSVMDWTAKQLTNPPTLRGENANEG